ncbi:histone-lysine N-methyltransferase met-2 [Selaginella moellendorffii]|uniref:histone-lysine N-methyltransferase met-2 n=1 Tax=Selaginella moellendorffii TaxID=88036 RepID=UPI000D1C79D6|nr:histone-lysine N-methyltransferase met-2 [Selaginella moellendorffii]|eukprot:XP_002965241.2 histone-lysine N-methyltransferase met-2 [Selaginella moellendorffii]
MVHSLQPKDSMDRVSFPNDFVANFYYVRHNIRGPLPPFDRNPSPRSEPKDKCGPQCSCQMQKRLAIFKTESCGWGVRAAETIPKDSFVCEYVGEVLDFSSSARHDYQFQMPGDARFPANLVVVDAVAYGNVARFINHRCDGGNIRVEHVPYEGLDDDERPMFHIMMFASRDIKVGEELCFDYSGGEQRYIYNEMCCCGSEGCCMAWDNGALPSVVD